MAVLTEAPGAPIAVEPGATGPSVVISAAAPELRRRIELALAEGILETTPAPTDSVDSLFASDLDPETIVVLACDVDHPQQLATLRRLRRGLDEAAILAVSPVATGTGIRRALDAGADAVVFEPELEATLAVAVSAVASGQSVVPRKLRAGIQRPAFSHRERQVLSYVTQGYTNAQIAEELFLSESTIKSHLSSAFSKLGVRSRVEAAALFLELNPQGAGE
jgi:DNA-binding NarL/FixJ family response regulator